MTHWPTSSHWFLHGCKACLADVMGVTAIESATLRVAIVLRYIFLLPIGLYEFGIAYLSKTHSMELIKQSWYFYTGYKLSDEVTERRPLALK
jgi:hypothetical protein